MTSFTIEIPDTTSFVSTRVAYIDLPAGTHLHRIHPDKFRPTQFNDTKYGNARFSPILNSDGEIIPTIYAANSFECAVGETILRTPSTTDTDPRTGRALPTAVRPQKWHSSLHSVVSTVRDLNLVDLTTKGQRAIGVYKNALLAGPNDTYPATRAWAQAIHTECPDAHGLYYTSHQYGPEYAIVLFGDRIDHPFHSHADVRSIRDVECDRQIRRLAEDMNIHYEDV